MAGEHEEHEHATPGARAYQESAGHDELDGHAALDGDGGHEGHGEHEGHGGHEGHEGHGLLHVFRERAIAVRTMDRSLRLMTGLALAELLGSAALLAVRGFGLHLPAISVFVLDNQLYQMPLPVFVVSLAFFALAWSYMLAGALHAHPLVRLGGLALFTWAMLGIRDVTQGPYQVAATAALALLWAVGLVTWIVDRRAIKAGAPERAHRHHLRGLTFGVVLLLVASLYGLAWASLRGLGALLFPEAVSVQLDGLQFALIPVLFLAGTDFAEWGEAVGERLAEATGRVRPPLLLAVVTALAALAILAGLVYQLHHEAVHQAVLGLIALGLVALLVTRLRRQRALPERVPYAALAGVAVAFFAVQLAPDIVTIATTNSTATAARLARQHPTGRLTTYRHEKPLPRFSMDYPAQWEVQPLEDVGLKQPLIMLFNGIHSANAAYLWVVEASASGEKTLARMRAEWFHFSYRTSVVQAGPTAARGPWQVTGYTEAARKGAKPLLKGYVWQRREGKLFWLLMSVSPVRLYGLYDATFQAMVDSWSPTVAAAGGEGEGKPAADAATPAVTPGDRIAAIEGLVCLAAALVGGAVLAFGARRLRSGALAAGIFFAVVAGLVNFFLLLPTIGEVYGHTLRVVPPGQHLHIAGYQAAVAIGSLLTLAWLVARRRLIPRYGEPLALLLGLNVSLQIVSWIFDGYSNASDLSGKLSIAQAAIVLLALLWDVTMSGEEITNVEGKVFPRHARVLLFFGYVMLVATQVLYYSSLQVQATGAAAEAQFETEMWPQSGLLSLGVPLLVALFVLKLCHWLAGPERHGAAAHGGGGPHDEAAPREGHAPEPVPAVAVGGAAAATTVAFVSAPAPAPGEA